MSYRAILDEPSKYHSSSISQTFKRYIRAILNNPDTRNVFFFLVLNLVFTVVEFLYGWINNSLGLTADAVHMLFDSTAIIFSLIASVITKWEANSRYTYGYGRVETLTGFINALALVFASVNIMWEAVERFFERQDLGTDNLLLVSVLGLLVNIVGIFAFDHGGSIGKKNHDCGHDHGHSHDEFDHSHDHHGHSHSHSHKNPLLHGWNWSDPICSILISLMTLAGAWPLLRESGEILLQRVPRNIEPKLPSTLRELMTIPGVVGYAKVHFWELNQGEYVGSILVQVDQHVEQSLVQNAVIDLFRSINVVVNVQIDKDFINRY